MELLINHIEPRYIPLLNIISHIGISMHFIVHKDRRNTYTRTSPIYKVIMISVLRSLEIAIHS